MSEITATGALVRLTVTSGQRRADIGVPSGIPVVELVPELARELGVLDPITATSGYQLVRHDGVTVDTDRSLAAQGIEDGYVLTMVDGGGHEPAKVYDDVVEAVADLVEKQFAPWTTENSFRTALAAAVTLFATGAVALFAGRDAGLLVPAFGGAVSVLLLLAGGVVTITRDKPLAGLALTGVGCLYAAVAGLSIAPNEAVWGLPLLAGGLALTVASAIGMAAVPRYRLLIAAGVVLGLGAAIAGALVWTLDWSPRAVASCAFALCVIIGNLVPWLAISASRLSTHPPRTEAEIYADVPPVLEHEVSQQIKLAQNLTIAVTVGTGLLALACIPQIVPAGIMGVALVSAGCVAILFRTRHTRTRSAVLVAMATGILGAALGSATLVLSRPEWRPQIAAALALTAGAIIALAVIVPKSRVRLGRIADVLEVVAMVAVIPLAVLAADLI